jgi:hypothetical protein
MGSDSTNLVLQPRYADNANCLILHEKRRFCEIPHAAAAAARPVSHHSINRAFGPAYPEPAHTLGMIRPATTMSGSDLMHATLEAVNAEKF